jgi:hypothetical protein
LVLVTGGWWLRALAAENDSAIGIGLVLCFVEVDPEIAYAKLAALVEGAAKSSERLYQ